MSRHPVRVSVLFALVFTYMVWLGACAAFIFRGPPDEVPASTPLRTHPPLAP